MLTELEIDQTIAELHDGIRSLDILDALWLMGVQAKQAIDLAAENERLKAKLDTLTAISERDDLCYAQLKAKLDAVRSECKMRQYGVMESEFDFGLAQMADVIMAIIDKDGDET